MAQILIRYAEIALKGGNRGKFEDQLALNIKTALGKGGYRLVRQNKQLVLTVKSNLINKSLEKLQRVFGIAWFAPVKETISQVGKIKQAAVRLTGGWDRKVATFAVRAARQDKNLPFTSLELERKVGEVVRVKTSLKVDLGKPDKTLYIVAAKKKALVFDQKIPGAGGLPVGTSGKVLSLVSGGFDSIVASYLLAKRGATVDFLHFHVFADPKKVLDSKIKTIVDGLKPWTLSQKLYLAAYTPFQMAVLDLAGRDARQELVTFRRLMVRVGQKLAQKLGYQALVLGDSLGQVASQTMENIVAVDQAVNLPIFRPLIGSDKQEVINLVKNLGLESAAIAPYKDCCSIISAHPATKADSKRVKFIEEKIKINTIIDEITRETKTIHL